MTSLALHTLVTASAAIADTRSRKEKTTTIADVLASAPTSEAALIVSLLAGEPRQGRIGIGWALLERVHAEPADRSTLTIADIDGILDDVAALTGPGSTAARTRSLEGVFSRATNDEADFLHRLLLGELRQGANEGMVVEGLAKAAGVKAVSVRRALMFSGDLALVASTAMQGGEAALAAISLELGRPMRPMLASTATDVDEAVAALGRCSVEWKLDGVRIQVHRRGDAVAIWTRNLNEITERLPGVAEAVRAMPVREVVLDGEVLGFRDPSTHHTTAREQGTDGEVAGATGAEMARGAGTPVAFQHTMSGLGSESGPAANLRPFFFDLLHLDGRDLVDAPLEVRRRVLVDVCGEAAVTGLLTDDPVAAAAVLEQALAAGHEGVMEKAADAPYEAGRRGKSWRKVKPVHTLDLVVLAAEWGHGRRRGRLSNLHLGARGGPHEFVMVGKTFKGLTDDLLGWQTDALLARKVSDSGNTVHVRPDLVVEIALDGIQSSTRYPGGVALRFARVRRYRPDKRASEADTIEAVRALGRRAGVPDVGDR